MNGVFHRPVMIAATLVAILTVTAMLWVALVVIHQPGSMQQRSARITDLAPPIHAHLLPDYTLLPVVRPVPVDPSPMRGPHLLPAHPAG
jgi:hypothetical protein